MVGALAPVLAPILGALLLPLIGWRGVFWTLVGVGALMFATTLVGVRETLPWHRRSAGGLGTTARLGREVLSSRTFVGYTGSVVLAFGCLFAYVAASPFVVQGVLGLSPRWYATDFAVNSTALIVVAGLNARLVERFDPARLLALGLVALLVAALVLLALGASGTTSRWLVLPLLFLVMAATALVMANGIGLAMGAVEHGHGTASALIGAIQFGLGAVVSPLVGLGGEGTVVPMALTMTTCASLGLLSLALARRAARAGSPHGAESGTEVAAA